MRHLNGYVARRATWALLFRIFFFFAYRFEHVGKSVSRYPRHSSLSDLTRVKRVVGKTPEGRLDLNISSLFDPSFRIV